MLQSLAFPFMACGESGFLMDMGSDAAWRSPESHSTPKLEPLNLEGGEWKGLHKAFSQYNKKKVKFATALASDGQLRRELAISGIPENNIFR